jgi:hypothetical protein
MHGPPAVSFPFGRSRVFGFLLLAASLAGALVCAAWYRQMDTPGWRLALALLVWVMGALMAWQTWRGVASGLLQWDGREWQLHVAGLASVGQPTVRLDWLGSMLLSWQPARGRSTEWLCVERASDPQHWDDLRRAVYSRATAEPAAH